MSDPLTPINIWLSPNNIMWLLEDLKILREAWDDVVDLNDEEEWQFWGNLVP
jgi:hypothetical protein